MKVMIGMTRSDTTLSGSFTHIRQIGEAFRDKGSEVVYVLGGTGVAIDKLRELGFRVIALPQLKRNIDPLPDMVALLRLLWLIMRERPDVCSWHTAKIGALGRMASWLTARRAYYVAHGVPFANTPLNKGYKLYERLELLLASLPSKILCVCRYDSNEYVRIGVPQRRLMIIPNGMLGKTIDHTPPESRHDRIRFITAARFEAQKDYATLAQACHQATAQGYDYELHIFGNGPMETEVRALFADLPAGAIHFRGVVDNFADELVQADVFLLSSHWEGLPRSVIEAMACARPVIGSDVGGVSELVTHGVNGHLVPHADVAAFTRAMTSYINDPRTLSSHGNAGLEIYVANYTLDVMINRYCSEYLQLEA